MVNNNVDESIIKSQHNDRGISVQFRTKYYITEQEIWETVAAQAESSSQKPSRTTLNEQTSFLHIIVLQHSI